MPDPERAPGAERPQSRLRRLDLAEPRGRHLDPVRDPTGQTGGGRQLPGRQIRVTRQATDLGLGQARLLQRRAHAELPRRSGPRPVVEPVVGVGAVQHAGVGALPRDPPQPLEQLALAEVTAVGRVPAVVRIRDLVRVDLQVREPDRFRQLDRELALCTRVAGRAAGHRQNAFRAQDVQRDLGQVGGIDASAVGDDG